MTATATLPAAIVGVGMIFDETYRPFFEQVRHSKFLVGDRVIDALLVAVVSRTGSRAASYLAAAPERTRGVASYHGPTAIDDLLRSNAVAVCVATPDDQHFPRRPRDRSRRQARPD